MRLLLIDSTRGFKSRIVLLAAVLFLSGCSALDSMANRWFNEPDLRNAPERKIDPQTGELLNGGVI